MGHKSKNVLLDLVTGGGKTHILERIAGTMIKQFDYNVVMLFMNSSLKEMMMTEYADTSMTKQYHDGIAFCDTYREIICTPENLHKI